MKRTMIWAIIAIFVLSACSAPSGAEQGGTTNSTMLANSTASTTISTAPTTTTKPTTSSTVSTTLPTTVSTAPTTVTTVPTTVSTTQPTTSTTRFTNINRPTTNRPIISTTKPTTNSVMPTTSTTQADDGVWGLPGFLSVYEKNGNYIYDITRGGEVEFSPDRKVVRTVLVEPIKCDNYEDLVNRSLGEIMSMFGEPHIVMGSGFYIPLYITEDAYILCLYLTSIYSDGIIEGVVLQDPTGNEPVRFWPIYDEQ